MAREPGFGQAHRVELHELHVLEQRARVQGQRVALPHDPAGVVVPGEESARPAAGEHDGPGAQPEPLPRLRPEPPQRAEALLAAELAGDHPRQELGAGRAVAFDETADDLLAPDRRTAAAEEIALPIVRAQAPADQLPQPRRRLGRQDARELRLVQPPSGLQRAREVVLDGLARGGLPAKTPPLTIVALPLPGDPLQRTVTRAPRSRAASAARRPAAPLPTTRTSWPSRSTALSHRTVDDGPGAIP